MSFSSYRLLAVCKNTINKYSTHTSITKRWSYRNFYNNFHIFLKPLSILCSGCTIALTSHILLNQNKFSVRNDHLSTKTNNVGTFKQGIPSYSIDEVKQHNSRENGIWVTYKEGVYDITNFIEQHPGGDQIMLAAGGSIEPFWFLYRVHLSDHVLNILETLRIGNINYEYSISTEDMSDPYQNDPIRHSVLKPATQKPFNAETPLELLVESFITPNQLFYVRNHLPVPQIDPNTYNLTVEIENTEQSKILTLNEIKKLPSTSITATLMCAGNRRSEMSAVKPVKGLNWGPAAVGTAVWKGILLRDLLLEMGINESSNLKHVQFEGADTDVTNNTYGASIPLWRALSTYGDVLLAYEMNGEELPRDHGFPLRVIVPGVVGARNVKWLQRITVSEFESSSHWQQNDYKGFSPSTDWDTVDFSKAPAIQDLPVISAICKPQENDVISITDGTIDIKGYAWSGAGQKIIRVDVSIDGGKTWQPANLDQQDEADPPRHWCWTLWSLRVPITEKSSNTMNIISKAVDSCYNTQPESFKNIWNLRGVLNNAYHHVNVQLKYSDKSL